MHGGSEFCVFGPPSGNNFIECVDFVRNYIDKRSTWLNQLWQPYIDNPFVLCDVNADGVSNTADLVVFQKWLLGNGSLANWKAADLYRDDKLDIYDFILMRRLIINKGSTD